MTTVCVMIGNSELSPTKEGGRWGPHEHPDDADQDPGGPDE